MALVFNPLPYAQLVLGSSEEPGFICGVRVALLLMLGLHSCAIGEEGLDSHHKVREVLCPVVLKLPLAFCRHWAGVRTMLQK